MFNGYASWTPATFAVASLAGALILWTAWGRNPKLAAAGAIALGWVLLSVLGPRPDAEQWALQGGLVFLFLHSLRWNDAAHSGAGLMRRLAGLAWVVQSFAWMNTDDGRFWMTSIPAAVVLGTYCVCLPARGVWRLFEVPAAALLSISAAPCIVAVESLRSSSISLVVVVAGFLALAAGAVVAVTREMWHER
jgi:hypothetical protein